MLWAVQEFKDVVEVFRKVSEHVLGCLGRVVGAEDEDRQFAALPAKRVPQLRLILAVSLLWKAWSGTAFARAAQQRHDGLHQKAQGERPQGGGQQACVGG